MKTIPTAIKLPNGDKYVPIMFKILSRDESGIPEDCTLVSEDRYLELVGGEEFLVAFVLDTLVRKEGVKST